MKIKSVNHVSINVSDINRAKEFYGTVLGLPYLETINDGPKDLVFYDLGSGARLEIFDYKGKAVKKPDIQSDFEALGYVHLAFTVDDVDAWADHFRKNNVTIHLEPCDLPHVGMRICLFLDPDGNVLEICSPLA